MKQAILAVLFMLMGLTGAFAQGMPGKATVVVATNVVATNVVDAVAKTTNAVAVPTDVTFQANGLTLPVDGDYTWQSEVVDQHLTFGTPQFDRARAECLAYEDAVKAYRAAADAGNFDAAVVAAPTYCLKAFAEINYLRTLMGGTRDDAGNWADYDLDKKDHYDGDNAPAIIAAFKKAGQYCVAAQADGRPADSKGNNVSKVLKYLSIYADGQLAGMDLK